MQTKAMMGIFAFTFVLGTVGCAHSSQKLQTREQIKKIRMEQFNQQKFGMFIHWGLYALPAGEWKGKTNYGEWIMLQGNIPSSEYEKFAPQFNPVKFNAQEWVALAKDAGMNYLVITAKHHDGFCMYDSALTEYDIVDATPFKRDPLKELADECRKAGIMFCTYYSIVDWHHPDFPQKYSQIRPEFPAGFHGDPQDNADIKKYAAYMKGQVQELLTKYGENGIMWFDGGGSFRNYDRKTLLDGEELVKMIHALQPACLINNRLGFGSDYGTPEQSIPESTLGTAFEVCMTLNRHWGYNKNDHDWKDAQTVIRNLIDVASKGGNYLLNVGPTAEGVIPEESVKILKEAGQWLEVNGQAVYGTTAGPSSANIRMRPAGCMTQKPGKLFLHVFDWPQNRKIFMEGMKGGIVKRIYLLADKNQTPLSYEPYERSLFIDVPAQSPSPYAGVVVIEYNTSQAMEENVIEPLTMG